MTFIKKYWFLIILAFFATLLLAWFLLLQPGDEVGPEERVAPAPSWNNITPGQSTLEDVRQLLGLPESESAFNNQVFLSYERQGGGPPHEVLLQESRVAFIKEQALGDKSLENIKARYGEPEASLWGPYAGAGYKVFVFPQKGIAAVAHLNTGEVLEVWYFEPLSLDQFLSAWGTGLTPQPKESF